MATRSHLLKEFNGDGKVHGIVPELEFRFDKARYEKVVKDLEYLTDKKRRPIRKAIERAAKQSADMGVTATKRGLARATTLKASEIGKRVKRYAYGNPTKMAIGMKISDTARPLSEFKFTPKKPTNPGNPVPVRVEIYKGQKRTLNDGGAFVAPVKAGTKTHIGIFKREGEEHLPIHSIPGPSVTGLFRKNEELHERVWNLLWDKFDERVEYELKRLLHG